MEPQTSTPSSLDPQAVNLAKAIRQTESGGNATAKGKSGEYGAYQYTPETWASDSREAGVNVPLNQATLEQQNQVAYTKIKKLKDSGMNVGQIASVWNSGKPDAYLDPSYKGTNKQGVNYDVPAYVKSVATAYQTLKNGGQAQIDPNNPSSTAAPQPDQPKSLGQEITGRVSDASGALAQAGKGVSEALQGNVGGAVEDVGSGLLQTAGAGAGAIGDVAQKGMEIIPGVKQLEGGIQSVLGGLAKTGVGKQVVGAVSDFVQAHPEAAKNIQAAINVASVIPLFKAASALVGVTKDAVGSAMSGSLTKAAGNEIEGVAMKTVGGRAILDSAEQHGLDPIAEILSSGELPTVETDGAGITRYATKNAYEALSTDSEEPQLQQMLAQVGVRGDLEASRQNALSAVEDEFKARPDYEDAIQKTNDMFDSYASRYGANPTLNEINDIKRGVRAPINFNSPKLESDLNYVISKSLMGDIEDTATQNGVPGVSEINAKMAAKIEAQKLLQKMDGARVFVNSLGKWARKAKMAAGGGVGEVVGNALGIPGAGTLGGMLMQSGAAEPSTALTRLSNVGSQPGLLKKLGTQSAKGLLPQLLRNKQEKISR